MSAVRASLLLLTLLLVAPPVASAADVFAIGSQARLTRVGPDGTVAVTARTPSVAYNSLQNEFLVVWAGNTTAGASNEILGQVLNGNGTPKGSVQFLSSVPDDEAAPTQPVVGYSPVVNQYVLGYIATPQVITPTPANSPDGQRELIAQVVTATGARSGPPARISDTDAADADVDSASDPALAYNPETDTYRFVWIASSANDDTNVEVWTQGVSSALVTSGGLELTVSNTASGTADEPAIAYLPAQNRFMVAWEAPNGTGGQAIFLRGTSTLGLGAFVQVMISNAGATATAARPAIAANQGRNEALVSFLRNDVTGEGPEVFVQRVTAAGVQTPAAIDQRVSTMGPANNLAFGASTARNTTASFHPELDRYLVTWAGDDDLPGLVDNEIERYGQALDGTGAEVGDDFRISVTGPDGNDDVAPETTATIAVPGRRAWFNVWDADDNRAPLANGEYELYGRFVGDDGDFDGHVSPADCNDANAGIHPGAVDVLDNGVDEDCSGADAQSPPPPIVVPAPPDRDGDGFAAAQDCNDADGAVRPGALEVRGNRIDENCDGVVEPFPTLNAGVVHNWAFKRNGSGFTLRVLQVTQQFPKGWRVEIKCSGKKCPFKAKALKAAKVKRNASNVIGSLSSKQRKFRAGQSVEVWVSAPGFNTKVARIPLKKGKQPVIQALCVVPGQTKPQKSCV